jgi:hypothetical protein
MLAGDASVIPLAIIVFVDAHDADGALPGALARAAERALGAPATISIQAVADDVDAAELGERARAAGARTAARVSWTDADRLAARLQVFEIEAGRVSTRTVVFEASDAPAERGRTLGLLLASVLEPEASGGGDRAPPLPVPARAPPATIAPAATPAPPERWAVDAAAEGGLAVGGAGSGVGGTAGVRWARWRRLSLRVGGRARFGEVGVAQASSTAYAFAAGAVVGIVPSQPGRRLALRLRLDALLLHESLTHLSSDDPAPVRRGRFLPGAAALAEVTWSLSPSVALMLAAGTEVAFGRTEVYVHDVVVTTLPPLRLLAQGGLLARF